VYPTFLKMSHGFGATAHDKSKEDGIDFTVRLFCGLGSIPAAMALCLKKGIITG